MNKADQKYWFFTWFFLALGIGMIISFFYGSNWIYLYTGIFLFLLGIARIYLKKFYKPFPYMQ